MIPFRSHRETSFPPIYVEDPRGSRIFHPLPSREPVFPRSRGPAESPTSCPHAARMSAPLLSRVIVWIPAPIRTSRKRSTDDGEGERKFSRGWGLKGIRLILMRVPDSSLARARASAGESFTPDRRTYSAVTLRPLWRGIDRIAATTSRNGYFRLTGMRRERTSSLAALRDTAKLTGYRFASSRIAGPIPAVETVTRFPARRDPYGESRRSEEHTS